MEDLDGWTLGSFGGIFGGRVGGKLVTDIKAMLDRLAAALLVA